MAASAYHVISKEVENQFFRRNWIFRQRVYKQPTLTKYNIFWQIITFFCKYYIVTSDTLAGFFLDVFLLLLAVILSELELQIELNKDWVTEKRTQKNLCEGYHFFDCTPSFLCHFLLLSSCTLLPKWRTCCMAPIKIYNIAMGGIVCNVENMKICCNLILAGWHL